MEFWIKNNLLVIIYLLLILAKAATKMVGGISPLAHMFLFFNTKCFFINFMTLKCGDFVKLNIYSKCIRAKETVKWRNGNVFKFCKEVLRVADFHWSNSHFASIRVEIWIPALVRGDVWETFAYQIALHINIFMFHRLFSKFKLYETKFKKLSPSFKVIIFIFVCFLN